MSLLKNLKKDASIAGERDSLGGGGVVNSGFYRYTIGLAYLKKSDKGALAVNLHLKDKDGGKDIRLSTYVTSGDDKGNKNTYEDSKGALQYLPGFLQMDSMALLAAGFSITDLDTEEKVVNLYDYDAKAEVPTKVDMITELLGKEIHAGVLKVVENKQKKNAAGVYEDVPGETRETNEIDKFFCAQADYLNMTVTEIQAKAEKATFVDDWKAKWTGKNKDKTGKSNGTAGAPGAPNAAPPGAAAATAKPKNSLFG